MLRIIFVVCIFQFNHTVILSITIHAYQHIQNTYSGHVHDHAEMGKTQD